ncbi:hypothetical protein ACLOJK_018026 [Asimina triloba]
MTRAQPGSIYKSSRVRAEHSAGGSSHASQQAQSSPSHPSQAAGSATPPSSVTGSAMPPSSLFPFPLSSPSAATPVWPCPQSAVNFRRIFLRSSSARSSSDLPQPDLPQPALIFHSSPCSTAVTRLAISHQPSASRLCLCLAARQVAVGHSASRLSRQPTLRRCLCLAIPV